MDQAGIRFDFDGSSFIGQAGKMTDAVQNVVKAGVQGGQALEASWEQTMRFVMQATDKQEQANKRLVLSMEMRNATYGQEMTEVQRLIAQRDEYNKRLQGSEEWLKRNNAAFAGMISKAEEAAKGAQFKEFGENITKFVEQPMMAGRSAVTGFLETLGPMGGLAAGATGALIAFAAAGYESAKAVGEASAQTRDLEIRMGVTDKQAGQLGFSAKAAGADVNVFERSMRGLTSAVEDTTPEAAKARQELGLFGVDIAGLKNGSAGTYETLLKISDGLAAIPTPLERNAAGMAIFKRAWFEMAPALLDLRENSEYFTQHGLSYWSDADAKKGLEYLRWATEVDNQWNNIKLHAEEAAAAVGKFLIPPLPEHPERKPPSMGWHDDWAATMGNQIASAPFLATRDRQEATFGYGEEGTKDLIEAAKKKESAARADYFADTSSTPVTEIQKHAEAWRDATKELNIYQARLEHMKAAEKADEGRDKLPLFDLSGNLKQQFGFNTLLDQMQVRARAELAKTASSTWEDLDPKNLSHENEAFQHDTKRDDEQLAQSIQMLNKTLTFNREFGLVQQESSIRVNGILGGRDQSLNTDRQMTAVKRSALDDQYRFEIEEMDAVAAVGKDVEDQRMQLRMQHARDVADLEIKLAEQTAQETRKQFDTIKASATSLWETALTHPGKFGAQLRTTMHEAIIKPVAEGLGGLTAQVLQPVIYGSDGHSGIAGMFKGTFGGFDKPIDPLKPALDSNAMATRQLTGEIANLGSEFRTARNFGSAGGSSASAGTSGGGFAGIVPWSFAAQRPSSYSSGGWGTNIFNPDFGGGSSMSGGGYGGSGSSGAPGDTSGFAGPVFQSGTTAAMPRGGSNPFAAIFGGRGGGGSPGGQGGGWNPLTGILGGVGTGSHSPSGFGGLLGGLKGAWTGLGKSVGWNGPVTNTSAYDPVTGQPTFSSSGGWSTGSAASSIMGSPAVASMMTTGGVALAEAGLLGDRRGTWGGIGEATAGGFMIGGPIGAAVGFGIGLGEKVAGVESPENKAKRLAKSIYGVNIDNQMAKQIVSMAQSKYANNIEMTVRSPEVRQMMGVYAAGTGQKMPLSASTPMGGSLAEQGGQLYQQATYQYGKSYSYGGNLPVLGGPTQGTIPNASQPLSMALNIQGQDMQSFMQGNVVTPEAIQNGMEAAWNAGNGRVSGSAAMMGVPNLIT